MMNEQKHTLPFEFEDMPEDTAFGQLMEFSESEVSGFEPYETFLDGSSDLYLGDGKNIYRVRKRMLEDGDIVLKADCVGVCNPDEYELIMENEESFNKVVGYVESDFAYYTEEDGFIPSPAETYSPESTLDLGSNSADKAVGRVLED